MGFAVTGLPVGEWIVDQHWWAERRQQMMTAVNGGATDDIAAGMPLERCGSR
jgi:selenocysteine-specific elongation factor